MSKIRNLICHHLYRKTYTIALSRAIISFTFDDIAESAAIVARNLLEKNKITGTFYVSAGLLGKKGPVGKYASEESIKLLAKTGHHIGCHTYSHISVGRLDSEALEFESEQNRIALHKFVQISKWTHFSYPHGMVSLKAKRILGSRFKTMRGISPGVNKGNVDLRLLHAVPIYNRVCSREMIERWIAAALNSRGWLIFYTHDVSENPSQWGTTPGLFEFALRKSVESPAQVLNIDQAYTKLFCPMQ